jgi:hypothetical protein
VIAAAFIVSATWQVERQVFGVHGLGNSATEPNCSYAIGAFEEALSNGLALAELADSRAKAEGVFEDKVSTPLSSVEKRCNGQDLGAYAAAVRLRDAAEASLNDQQTALAPLRAAVRARRNP